MTDPVQMNKRRAARAALDFLHEGMIVGIGTGSTVETLIEQMPDWRSHLAGAVSSSERTSQRLRQLGLPVLDLNQVPQLALYIDGADEATRARALIKGGGGALTREKILAAAAETFVCIIDERKLVARLGAFPLPVEVIPMGRNYVAHRLRELGGRPQWRRGVITDNGNEILDVHGLDIQAPAPLEAQINQIAGVVTVGLFAARSADVLLVGHEHGVERL